MTSAKYFDAISLVVTRSHSWSLVVTRGHSWSLVCTFRHDLSQRGHPNQFQLTFFSYAYQRQKLIS